MKIRCKFQVTEVGETAYELSKPSPEDPSNWVGTGKRQQHIRLSAVYDNGNQENASFAAATPCGSMEFTVTNPDIVGTIKPGAFYYIDLVPVEQ